VIIAELNPEKLFPRTTYASHHPPEMPPNDRTLAAKHRLQGQKRHLTMQTLLVRNFNAVNDACQPSKNTGVSGG